VPRSFPGMTATRSMSMNIE
jgi:hypothetical protein